MLSEFILKCFFETQTSHDPLFSHSDRVNHVFSPEKCLPTFGSIWNYDYFVLLWKPSAKNCDDISTAMLLKFNDVSDNTYIQSGRRNVLELKGLFN